MSSLFDVNCYRFDNKLLNCTGKTRYPADANVCISDNFEAQQKLLKKQKYCNKSKNAKALASCGHMHDENRYFGFAAVGEYWSCKLDARKAQFK